MGLISSTQVGDWRWQTWREASRASAGLSRIRAQEVKQGEGRRPACGAFSRDEPLARVPDRERKRRLTPEEGKSTNTRTEGV